MIINHLPNGVTEYITEKAIVRVHPGKSEEELKVSLEEAVRRFYRAIEKKGQPL